MVNAKAAYRTFLARSIIASILAPAIPGVFVLLPGFFRPGNHLESFFLFLVGPSLLVAAILGPPIIWFLERRCIAFGIYIVTYIAVGALLGSVTAIVLFASMFPLGLILLPALVLGAVYGAIVGACLGTLVTFMIPAAKSDQVGSGR